MKMTSSRPYLIRALYQWIVDNGLTPYILVDASFPNVDVPREFVQDGKIVLNIAPMAVQALILGDNEVTFSARFSGQATSLVVPVPSVLAIYAKENGQGMMFGEDGNDPKPPSDKPRGKPESKDKKPRLRVVK